MLRVGLLLSGTDAPEGFPAVAQLAEDLGFDEVWVTEDLFYSSGIATAVSVLAATSRIRVGIGVVSIMTRNPALLAVELATIARLYPGRLIAGVGVGLPAWLEQMHVRPRSLTVGLREGVDAVRRLLAGEEVTVRGEVVSLDRVQLEYPLREPLQLSIGVAGPRLLKLAGEIGDGVILGLNASADYVRWALSQVESGSATRADHGASFAVTCLSFFGVEQETAEAMASVRGKVAEYLALGGTNAMTDSLGISDELNALIAKGGQPAVSSGMPASWLEELAIAGDSKQCAARIMSYREAGVDSIVLYPQSTSTIEHTLRRAATEVLPLLPRGKT
jgi:alkanesulfonate monooxygenase SsuD/methylene tetrahydromethanopterin reductase-like flavin-dependent oxidoreductase (luciferase family)